MTEFDVNLRDLQAWSAMVGRASGGMAEVQDYGSSYVSDGDFGRILSLVTDAYCELIPAVGSSMLQAAANLADERDALAACVSTYRRSDDDADVRFGGMGPGGEG